MKVFTGLIITKMVAEIVIKAEDKEQAEKIIDVVADDRELDIFDFEEDEMATEVISSWDLSNEQQARYAEKEIKEAQRKRMFFDKSILEE